MAGSRNVTASRRISCRAAQARGRSRPAGRTAASCSGTRAIRLPRAQRVVVAAHRLERARFTAAGLAGANRGGADGATTSRERDEFASALHGDNDLREGPLRICASTCASTGSTSCRSPRSPERQLFVQSVDVDVSSATLLDDSSSGAEHNAGARKNSRLLSTARARQLARRPVLPSSERSNCSYSPTPSRCSLSPPPGPILRIGPQTAETVAYAGDSARPRTCSTHPGR